MTRQAAQVGLEGVESFDAGSKAQPVDGFLDRARRLLQPGSVLVHQQHHAGVVAHRHQSAVDLGDGGLGILHHGQGILIDRTDMGVEDLIEKAPDLLAPFPAELVQVPDRLVRIHEDEAARPAVFARQLAQGRQQTGGGLERKTLDRHHLQVAPSDLRHHPTPELLATNQRVQVDRMAGQLHRLVDAGHAELQPAQEIVLRAAAPVLVEDGLALHAGQLQRRGQTVLEVGDLALELLDQALRARLVVRPDRIVIEHELDEAALGQHRREPAQCQHEIALVHLAQALEQAASLLVDRGRYRIGKMRQAAVRILGGGPAHRIDMQHPAIAQAGQGLVDAHGHRLAFGLGAAGVVGPLVEPGGHEGAVLAHDHAVVDHRGIVEQIGQTRVLGPVGLKPVAGSERAHPGVEGQQQAGAKHRHGDRKGRDHRYCAP